MARISGVDLPNDKRVEIGLTYISVSAEQPLLRLSKLRESIRTLVAEICQRMKFPKFVIISKRM